MCTDSHKLLDLNRQLKELLQQFRHCLPQEDNIVLCPSIISQASRIKRKYAKLKTNTPCSALLSAKEKGRKRASSGFRNRVGTRADRLRKVFNKFDNPYSTDFHQGAEEDANVAPKDCDVYTKRRGLLYTNINYCASLSIYTQICLCHS